MRLAKILLVFTLLTVVTYAEGIGPLLGNYVPDDTKDQSWGVWVGGDLEIASAVVAFIEGRAFVRGDFIANGSPYNYKIGDVTGGSGVGPDLSLPILVVGGDITGSGGFLLDNEPTIQVGSNIAHSVTIGGDYTLISGGIDYAAADKLRDDLSAKSRYWGELPDTVGGSASVEWGNLVFRGDGENDNPQLWVFNIDSDITEGWGITFEDFEDGDTILINCKKSDDNDTFIIDKGNSIIPPGDLPSRILWNIPEAAEVEIIKPAAFYGSILIGNPESVTTITANDLHHGRFISCGDVISNKAPFHNYPFIGNLPEAPLSSAIDIRAFMGADGVYVEFVAYDVEEGGEFELILLDSNGNVVWRGEVPAVAGERQIVRFKVPGLELGGKYRFAVRDEVGNYFDASGVEVRPFAAEMIRMDHSTVTLAFETLVDREYTVQWSRKLGSGWSDVATVMALDERTVLKLPRDPREPRGFYRIVLR